MNNIPIYMLGALCTVKLSIACIETKKFLLPKLIFLVVNIIIRLRVHTECVSIRITV